METDRTGAMLRDTYHCCSCFVGGVLSLVILGGAMFFLHEQLLPTSEIRQRILEGYLSRPLETLK